MAGAVVQATPRPARQSCTGITAELDTLEYDVLPVRPRVQPDWRCRAGNSRWVMPRWAPRRGDAAVGQVHRPGGRARI